MKFVGNFCCCLFLIFIYVCIYFAYMYVCLLHVCLIAARRSEVGIDHLALELKEAVSHHVGAGI